MLQLTQISLNFKTSCCNLKSDVWEQNCVWPFYYFNFERNYDVLKSKSPCILFNKNINLNKNETESKMENPTYSFRQTILALQLMSELQIKSKTAMSCSTRKKKRGYFLYRLSFILSEFCVLSQCIVY